MADTASNRRTEPSRLQRRAPASIQVNRCTDWNVAIPFLSPLPSSPPSIYNPTAEVVNESRSETASSSRMEQKKPIVLKKWQHPAAPFCYESSTRFAPCLAFCNELKLSIK